MSTFQALLVTAIAVLPGALYTLAYEREANLTRAALPDRVLRLTAGSAIFQALIAPLSYWFYVRFWRSGDLAGGPVPALLWLVVLGYVAVPMLAGRAVGIAVRRQRPWARVFSGPSPEPRAWDAAFGHGRSAWLRIRLKDSSAGTDGWLLGVFAPARAAPDSFASAHPDPPDLYLSDTAEAEPGTGRFVLDIHGRPRLRGVGLLIAWDQISYIEIIWG